MSAYLQRLVETARAARPAVRPTVPLMFSPAQFGTEQLEPLPGKGMELEETIEPAGEVGVRMEATHPTSARDHHAPIKGALSQAHTEDQHVALEPAMVPHWIDSAAPDERITAYQPLLPTNQEQPVANEPARRAPFASEPQPAAMDVPVRYREGPVANQSARPAPFANEPQPTARDAPVPFAGVRPQTPSNVLSIEWPETAEYPARRPYPSSLPAVRTTPPVSPSVPDHIEIHIGRVEVTAAPAAAVAPAAKQTPKGPSLQEYLKHRERRPR